jgi:hypothetical protein
VSDEADALRAEARRLRSFVARDSSPDVASHIELLAVELERRATAVDGKSSNGHDEPTRAGLPPKK